MSNLTGRLVGRYSQNKKQDIYWLLLYLAAVIWGAIMLYLLLEPHSAIKERTFCMAIALPVVFCGGLGTLLYGLKILLVPVATVEIHEDGFVILRQSRSLAYKWEELKEYWVVENKFYSRKYSGVGAQGALTAIAINDMAKSKRFRLKLRTMDGKTFELVNYTNMTGLAESVIRLSLAPLTTRIARAIKAHTSTSFGNISLTPDGLQKGSKRLAFKDIARVGIVDNQVIVLTRDPRGGRARPFVKTKVSDMPNAYVFVELLNRVHDSAEGINGVERAFGLM